MRRLLPSSDPEVLLSVLVNPHFEERDALFLLHRKDLPPVVLQELATIHTVARSYAVRLALAKHPKAPLHIALEQVKFLFLFDLVSVCLQPGVPAPVKRASEEQVLTHVPKLPIGERLTLARRASARVAASLLKGENAQIIQAVLDNPYLTEAVLLRVLDRPDCSPKIVQMVARHPKWGFCYDIRLALLRNSSLPVARALAIVPDLKVQDAQAMAQDSRVIPQVRNYLANQLKGSKGDS